MFGYDWSFTLKTVELKEYVEIASGLASVYIGIIVYKLSLKTHEDAQPQIALSVHRSSEWEDNPTTEIIVSNLGPQSVFLRSILYRFYPDGAAIGQRTGVNLGASDVIRFEPINNQEIYVTVEAFNGVEYRLFSPRDQLSEYKKFVVDRNHAPPKFKWLEKIRVKILIFFHEL